MTSIVLAKLIDAPISEQQRQAAGAVLFEVIGGLTEADQLAWKYLWREMMAAGSGEIFTLDFKIVRAGPFHRRHFKLEGHVFKSQEAFYSEEQFRNWLKTGAAFVDWHLVRGQLTAVPRSVSYDKCDQLTMEKFHYDAIAFLRTPRAQQQLYPHLSAAMAEKAIETLLSEFDA